MKKTILLTLVFLTPVLAQAIPSRWNAGQIELAIATVGGVPVYTVQEQTNEVAKTGGSVQVLTSAQFEVNLSTCFYIVLDGVPVSGFSNNSDFLACQTKIGLKRKIMQIRALIDSMSDLPLVDSRDLKERSGWIKSYYLTLP